MKKLITIMLVAITVNCFSQNTEMVKPYLLKGDSLYKAKLYNKALDSYNTAYRYDRGNKSIKPKLDSCIYHIGIQEREADHTRTVTPLIKQLKDKKVVLIFDANGNVVSYKKEGEDIKLLSDWEDKYNVGKIEAITQKDWEGF